MQVIDGWLTDSITGNKKYQPVFLTRYAYLSIAGADKVFVQAKAKIEGDKVMVWNDELPNPMYVRYAWADSPPYPNLLNKEGLPASPFRTDGF